MKYIPVTGFAILAALTLASPAVAQGHSHSRDRGNHDGSTGSQPQGHVEHARPRNEGQAARPEVNTPRPEATASRPESRREASAPPAPNHSEVAPRAVPRGEVVGPRADRPVVVEPRVDRPYARPYYASRYARPYYARPYYVRPYVFRPHLRQNFGIFVGYPFAYSYAYPYPVPVYGYGAPVEPVVVGPGSTYYGGVSLEFTPGDASVFVDGNYAGIVEDFDGTRQPLNLATGPHRIELQAPGYEPLAFDVVVQPGEVVPYRGDMFQY